MTARKRSLSHEVDGDSGPLAKRIALLSVDSATSGLNEDGAHQTLNNNYAPSCYPASCSWQQQSLTGATHQAATQQLPFASEAHHSFPNGSAPMNPGDVGTSHQYLPGNLATAQRAPPFDLPPAEHAYDPELDASANPEYYDSNSVLFHAHLCRMQRLGQPLPQ